MQYANFHIKMFVPTEKFMTYTCRKTNYTFMPTCIHLINQMKTHSRVKHVCTCFATSSHA